MLVEFKPNLAVSGSSLVEFGQIRAEFGPHLVEFRAMLDDSGQTFAEIVPITALPRRGPEPPSTADGPQRRSAG